MTLDLILKDIQDPYVRENFHRLLKALDRQTFLKGTFKLVEISVPKATAEYRYKHGLGFQPKDIIVTSVIGVGDLTWDYDLFDSEFIYLTTTDELTVRAFVGTHREDG